MLEIELADGTVLEFEDGTDPQVIQQSVARFFPENTPSLPQEEVEEEQSVGDFAKGTLEAFTQGGTLGFSDEIESVIAATIASPFVSDKTFGELMKDARKSIRDEQAEFREKNPKTALAAEVTVGS